MISSVKIRQYWEIFRYIKTREYATWEQIFNHLRDLDLGMSKRTFERAKKEIENLGIELKYHHGRGYSVEMDESPFYESIDEFMHTVSTFSFVAEGLKDFKKLRQHIQLTTPANRVSEQLTSLIDACINHEKIKIEHASYQTNQIKMRSIDPYVLREFKGRWYVIGEVQKEGRKQIQSFGVDRIHKVIKTGKKYKSVRKDEIDKHYKYVIGLWSNFEAQPEEVILEVDATSWKWIESLPWHDSQKFLYEENEIVRFSLYVKPTIDLQRNIMEWAPHVKVISPESLRSEIKHIYEQGHEYYG